MKGEGGVRADGDVGDLGSGELVLDGYGDGQNLCVVGGAVGA